MANVVYDKGKKNILNAVVGDMSSVTIKVALTTGYNPTTSSTDEFWSAVSSNEVSGTGYTAGGATLGSATVTADATNHRGVFDAADATWSTSTISATGAVLYKSTGTSSTSPIIGFIDFGGTKSSSAGNFTIQWDSNGILYV